MSQPTFVMRVPTSRRSAKLAANSATAGDTVLYEVPSEMSARLHSIWICSYGSGNHTIRLHHTRSSEAVSGSNALLYDAAVSAKTTLVYDQPVLLSSGDRIWIRADTADRICVTIYGDEA